MREQLFDVVIIGGGPAGCATALRLKQLSELSILLIDSGNQETQRIGESIPPDSRLLLKKLALWDDFVSDNHDPCLGNHSMWGHSELGYNDYLFNPMGHGWHLNRQIFDRRLITTVTQRGVEYWHNSRVYQTQWVKSCHQLVIKTPHNKHKQIPAKFIVDATGKNSRISKKLGSTQQKNDDMVCITGFFQQTENTEISKQTLLEAVEYGWWYTASLPNNGLAVALACDRSFAKRFKINHFNNWHILLSQSTQKVSRTVNNMPFIKASLRVDLAPSFILDKTVGKNWLATGDAACAFDPISAGGIYKSLTHGIKAAETITECFDSSKTALNDYHQLINDDYQYYLMDRKHLYDQEQRWPNSPFWQNRQTHRKSLGSAQLHKADWTL